MCAALLLILSVPARAAEAPDAPEPPEAWEAPPVDPASPAEDPAATPEVPEIPAVPEIPDTPEAPPDDPDFADAPLETPEDPENPEAPEDADAPENFDGMEDEPALAEPEPPVIHVTVPDTGRIIVNPYRLEVKLDGIASTEQVVGVPMPIVSTSSVPVAVLASVTGYTAPDSDVVFTVAPPQPDAWAKELFLYAEFQPAYDEYGSGAYWTGAYNQLTVTPEGTPAAQVMELAAGDEAPSCGAFRLFGSAAVTPDNPWCAEDAIQVTVAFTFLPLSGPQQI